MAITIEVIMLALSWVTLFIGIGFLIFSPPVIYKFLKTIITKTTYITDAERNEKLKDRHRLLDYYLTAGITITIIGFLLILIFSNKLVLLQF